MHEHMASALYRQWALECFRLVSARGLVHDRVSSIDGPTWRIDMSNTLYRLDDYYPASVHA